MFADVGARHAECTFGTVRLRLRSFVEHEESPIRLSPSSGIPITAPNDFDYVPASSAEEGFELLYDLAIAAHRSVKPLQIAIHDEDQIVKLLTRRKGNGS